MGEFICGKCRSKMLSLGNGYYQCPKCRDDPALLDGDEDDGYSYDSVYGEIPECCRTCGGNYSDCQDSCKIFSN